MRRWEWLKGVLDGQAGRLSTAQLIEHQAAAWHKAKRAQAWLDLRGDRLREAVAVAGLEGFRKRLEGLPAAYLQACRRQASATKWATLRSYAWVAVLLLGIGGAVATHSRWFPIVDAAAYRLVNMKADLTKPGQVFQDCSTCPPMVVIPAGSFIMGSPDNEAGHNRNEGPQHKVAIGRPFAVSKFAITFDQWDACFLAGGCTEKGGDSGWGRGNQPAINVNWNDAHQYVKWASAITGQKYRLLTEAEWEYATRAGTTTRYSFGDDEAALGDYAWFKGNSDSNVLPVGEKKPNPFGLHDMHGNVWQWVQDCYVDSYEDAPADGSAVQYKKDECSRVLRGGSSYSSPQSLRSALRNYNMPDIRINDIGFRLARTLPVTPLGPAD